MIDSTTASGDSGRTAAQEGPRGPDGQSPARLTERIRAAELSLVPFAHAVLDDFLPQRRYEELVTVLRDENFRSVDEFGATRGYDSRDVLYFDTFKKSSATQHPEYWAKLLADLFFHPEFTSEFIRKLAPHTPFGSAAAFLAKPFRLNLQVIRDRGGYALPPHTDAGVKLGSLLLYAPDVAGDFEGAGTVLFQPDDPAFCCPTGSNHYHFTGFHEVKNVPYRSNAAFFFARGPRSFHGVRPVPSDRTRYLLQYSVQRVYKLA
jgi:hypothetical protein